ncbi:MAG: peptidase M48 [Porticoccus sp.]|nr:peptidase M48 [Porticoccus sp.]
MKHLLMLIGINKLLTLIKRSRCSFLIFLGLILIFKPAMSADIKLPLLGDASSGTISVQKEYELGQAWLKAYRGRVNENYDPLIRNYLEQLIFKLASKSRLEDRRIELIVVNNPTLNAFAVPGGVIGIHTGLFTFAKTEDEIASVIAHEIAHLSQRHFARRLNEQKKNKVVSMAGLLTSLVLAATAGSDAAMAGLSATQTMGIHSALGYSRQNEREADRLALQTMIASGMNPNAMSDMFESMLKITRHASYKIPEWLRTHPQTQERVADAKNRANRLKMKEYSDNFEFHLMKARAVISNNKDPNLSLNHFKSILRDGRENKDAANYGIVLSHIALKNFTKAKEFVDKLLKKSPNQIHYKMAEIEIYRHQAKYDNAVKETLTLLKYHPENYPLRMSLAETYLKANRFFDSEKVLDMLKNSHPNNPEVWFQLAEIRGLAGNIPGVHEARAEYFILIGVFSKARDQLMYARKLLINDYNKKLIIDQKIKNLEKIERGMKNL